MILDPRLELEARARIHRPRLHRLDRLAHVLGREPAGQHDPAFGGTRALEVLRIFLAELDGWVALRREAAARYAELGLGAACDLPEDEPGHAYHLFVCRSSERDRIRAALNDAAISSAVYYVTPLHLQPALAYLGYAPGSLPVTEQLARENFSVPLWAGIDAQTQERVVSVVQAAAPVAS